MLRTFAIKYKRLCKFSVLLVLTFFSAQLCFADTEVGGNITEDTTWTRANSPYLVTSTLQIWGGATLTIEPGVLMKIDPGISFNAEGNIVAVGLNNRPITFTSPSPEEQWGGIFLLVNNNGSRFEKCIFKNAFMVFDLRGPNAPVIENNIFEKNYLVITGFTHLPQIDVCYNLFKNNYNCFYRIRIADANMFKY